MSDPLRPPPRQVVSELLRLTRRVVALEKHREKLLGRAAELEGELLQARRLLRSFVNDQARALEPSDTVEQEEVP